MHSGHIGFVLAISYLSCWGYLIEARAKLVNNCHGRKLFGHKGTSWGYLGDISLAFVQKKGRKEVWGEEGQGLGGKGKEGSGVEEGEKDGWTERGGEALTCCSSFS